MARPSWEHAHYSFYSNRQCEYFPCHRTEDPDNFNCLFCYCPLYALGRRCGGNFRYTKKGIKDCTDCLFPHRRENYPEVVRRFGEIARRMCDFEQECAPEGDGQEKGPGSTSVARPHNPSESPSDSSSGQSS